MTFASSSFAQTSNVIDFGAVKAQRELEPALGIYRSKDEMTYKPLSMWRIFFQRRKTTVSLMIDEWKDDGTINRLFEVPLKTLGYGYKPQPNETVYNVFLATPGVKGRYLGPRYPGEPTLSIIIAENFTLLSVYSIGGRKTLDYSFKTDALSRFDLEKTPVTRQMIIEQSLPFAGSPDGLVGPFNFMQGEYRYRDPLSIFRCSQIFSKW